MMTKLERLRIEIIDSMTAGYRHVGISRSSAASKFVDALIAAVREDEREKIAENGQHFELGDDVSGSDYLTCVHLQPEVDVDVSVIAEEDCYIVPASILAPKESEKEGYA